MTQSRKPSEAEPAAQGSSPDDVAGTNLIQKLVTISRECPSLKKDERNDHGKFNFVSIDEYYESVASVALKHGVFWLSTVTKVEPDGDILWFHYEYTIFDGGNGKLGPVVVVVPHPWQKAQTAGSAQSYADKVFMRQVFKVVTGEPDADAMLDNSPSRRGARTTSPPAAQAPLKVVADNAPSKSDVARAKVALTAALDAFSDASTKQQLVAAFNRHRTEVQTIVKSVLPDEYANLQATYSALNERLPEE